jgi:cell division transport system permease protein
LNSLKSHFTLILALISILFSIFLFRLFSNILTLYQKNIVDNYSVVVVSTSKIQSINLPIIEKTQEIDTSEQMKNLQKKFKNIDFSKVKLPYFYKLKLKSLPSPSELKSLEFKLKQYPFIKRVLTHSSSQTKIYNLLMLLNLITKTFMAIVAILGFLLIIKQLEVWKLVHNERMYIMELFGAPVWFRGAALFKIAFLNSLIALIITFGLIYYVIHSPIFITIINELNIDFKIDLIKEFLILFGVSISISLITSILVVVSKK